MPDWPLAAGDRPPGLKLFTMHSAPLRLLNDGDSAVFRVVARSGDVLTPGFLHGAGHPARPA